MNPCLFCHIESRMIGRRLQSLPAIGHYLLFMIFSISSSSKTWYLLFFVHDILSRDLWAGTWKLTWLHHSRCRAPQGWIEPPGLGLIKFHTQDWCIFLYVFNVCFGKFPAESFTWKKVKVKFSPEKVLYQPAAASCVLQPVSVHTPAFHFHCKVFSKMLSFFFHAVCFRIFLPSLGRPWRRCECRHRWGKQGALLLALKSSIL